MQRISLVNIAHSLVKDFLRPGDIAIDATVGNGHDTLYLVKQISPTGKVYGFDVQQAAIDSAKAKFQQNNLPPECLNLIHASHSALFEQIPLQHHGKICAIMFNLGYLPGGDKSIITQTDSTLIALTIASRILSSNGIITILSYPGHQGGDLEAEQVKNWCEQLDRERFKVDVFYSAEQTEAAPRLFVIYKLSSSTIPNSIPVFDQANH